MDKRTSQRKTGKFLAAAVAGLGLAGFGAAQSSGALVVDLRAMDPALAGQPGAYTFSADRKTVQIPSVGTSVFFEVYGIVSGSNSTQIVANNLGGSNFQPDTRNDDSLQIVTGMFSSGAGGLLGDMTAFRDANFAKGGSSDGTAFDLDGDGDLDIGVAGPGPEGMFVARSDPASFATIVDNGASQAPPGSKVINASHSEMVLGVLQWTTDGGGGAANINFIPRSDPGGGTATWFEDGSTQPSTPGSGSFTTGTPVNVSIIPEPASLGLLGLAGLGLLARRRNNA